MKFKKILSFLLACTVPFVLQAQVTTSSITGSIKNSKEVPLVKATIRATHIPSGSVYTSVSQANGRFTLSNMRVGGPYKIEISYVGYNPEVYNNLHLELGAPLSLDAVLEESSTTLTGVSVTSQKNSLISSDRTGPSTQISQAQLQTLPTINRNIDDYTRLVPQAQARKSSTDGSTMGVSFAGASNKYNQFSIDGANATDVFGLAASGTNGGQAALNPIPFDAIDQVQIVLSPYDVTLSGFTGGGVNAVTRSGTNKFHGSVYGFNQNQGLVGKSPNDNSKYGNFKDNTFGARLGGPIIKNKLFFFVNYENERRTSPVANLPGSATSQVSTSTLDGLSTFLKDSTQHPGWTYNPGAYTGFDKEKKSDAIFARIDWNINDNNKLTLRHNYVKGSNFVFSDGTSSASFYNNGYNFNSTTNSTVLELNSSFSGSSSNMFRLTYTNTKDDRSTPGDLFPGVSISDNGATYSFGTEQYSQANSLSQKTFTLTDNFNIYAGKHTITLGTDNQFYNSKNLFLAGYAGNYSYGSLQNFYDDASGTEDTAFAKSYKLTYSTDPKNPQPLSNVHAAQFSLYAQDVYSVTDRFKLTYGLRADVPVFTNKPAANDAFNSSDIAMNNNVATNKVPKASILLSPRVGFNWDVNGNRKTQLRGGVGLFTGRVPFVWISNQYGNTGIGTVSSSLSASAVASNNIHFDPVNAPQPSGYGPGINTTDPKFKYPRTMRANLAIDQKLPLGFIGSIEGIYTKTLQDILYHDINLAPATSSIALGNTTRPFYGSRNNIKFSNIYSLGNTNKGYSYNITVSLAKVSSRGWSGSIAYSLGHSYTMNDGTSSQASSNYRYAYNINGSNNLDLARSNYDQGSRIIGYVGKKFKYGKIFSTSVGLVYTGQSGQPLSFVYYGDINGDDGSTPAKLSTSGGADLIYLPSDASQFVTKNGLTPNEQFAAFQVYINSDDYLRSHKGQNTKRNADRLPWENHFDLKVEQGIAIYKEHTLSFVVNVLNVGNLISQKWGKSYYSGNQEKQPINVDHFTTNADGTITPSYYFNPKYGLDKFTNKPWSYSDFLSRWSMQLGLRYSF
ncbi:MAG: carboxypeptidase regulatory-like domain-containing protein [Bacteroidota bacterium]|nr:carboxypeptidase regulatory-like domain-containing protein [Bacteroidota bacterium]